MFLDAMIQAARTIQNLLFDAGDLSRRKRFPCRLSKERRSWLRKQRERFERRQSVLFGPRRASKKEKRHKNWFHLFPDNLHDVSDVQHLINQIIISELSALVRKQWSDNKERKANHFPIKPVILLPLSMSDADIDLDMRERME
jgi:hypothetical protein